MQPELAARYKAVKQQIIDDFFSRMNPMQKQAVFALDGPVLILAGAGSGKTTVIINRIANMIQFGDAYLTDWLPETISQADITFLEEYAAGDNWEMERAFSLLKHRAVQPWNILAITFTNKAAGELRKRLADMLGSIGGEVNASTFHSCCARILRREIDRLGYSSSFTIYDTDDSVRVIKQALKELNLDEKQCTPKAILGHIGRAKDKLQSPAEFAAGVGEDYRLQLVAKIYPIYQRQLKNANAVDFDDIIRLTVQLFQEYPEVLEQYRNRFRYVMVDEYQDTNRAQFELVRLLASQSGNLCVVGDDDQSIYKFRGATIENILQFEDTFAGAKVIRLEQNYRSTSTILSAANAVIEHNTERKGKTLWTQNETGEKIRVYRAIDENAEAQYLCDTISEHVKNGAHYADHVVLYRMNAQAQALERGMVKAAIPYKVIGGLRFYERKEIKDMIAYLSVIHNPSDTLRLRRIINEPKRKIGDSTLAAVTEIADQEGISAFEVLENADRYDAFGRKAADLMQFAQMVRQWQQQEQTMPLDELLDAIAEQSGYLAMLRTEGFEGQTRLENIEELKSTMKRYSEEGGERGLTGFLEEISLYTDLDKYDPDADTVILMTMHSAKGLEFNYVFVVGIEEGIFPGVQSMYNPELIEEERRLAYVSLTRAKKQLYISTAAQRMLFGQTMRNRPSRFLQEVPQEFCETEDATLVKQATGVQRPLRQQYSAHDRDRGVGAPLASPQDMPLDYRPGDSVSHKVFGRGMVVSAVPMGNDLLVEVAFDTVGTKKVMAKFARLCKEN